MGRQISSTQSQKTYLHVTPSPIYGGVHIQVKFTVLLFMHTALGSQGDGVQGSVSVGRGEHEVKLI